MDPKYKIGDYVQAKVVRQQEQSEWVGMVYQVGGTPDDGFEYWITNAPTLFPGHTQPLLVWESEIIRVV